MSHEALIARLDERLAIGSLSDVPFERLVSEFANQCREAGLPVARVSIAWRLLDPRYASQVVRWSAQEGVAIERFDYHDGSRPTGIDDRSPLQHVAENRIVFFRRRLCDPGAPRDFPILDDFAARGYTDYVLMLLGFGSEAERHAPGTGVIVGFCCDAPGGFADEDIATLLRLRFMLALAARTSMQREAAHRLVNTYLARSAGRRVLDGQIRRGDGEVVDGLIWFCDLRDSTALCETLGTARYIGLLNDYFTATAGSVVEAGGDVLDFIGDAVLAIFPASGAGLERAAAATRTALTRLDAFRLAYTNALAGRREAADVCGIAMDLGRVLYGNIGINERLTFSVIGPTVNKVTRLERLAKRLHEPVIVTRAVADAAPGPWRPLGTFGLDGVAQEQEVFALEMRTHAPAAPDAGAARGPASEGVSATP